MAWPVKLIFFGIVVVLTIGIILIQVENNGAEAVSKILLPFSENQAKNLAFLSVTISQGKGKTKSSSDSLPVEVTHPEGMPQALTWYAVSLPKELGKGGSLTLEVKAVFTHLLSPFPEKITQADSQLVAFQDSAHYISPYAVKIQSLTVKLPEPKVESYTKLESTKFSGQEIKYGPYENIPAFSFPSIVVHFVSNKPFSVAQELVREIEISHWGNVQVTENYNLIHGGAEITGEFSRYNNTFNQELCLFIVLCPVMLEDCHHFLDIKVLSMYIFPVDACRLDYQARPHVRGPAALRNLVARLPPRAHSIYYRDEIGNISTSNVWSDSAKVGLDSL